MNLDANAISALLFLGAVIVAGTAYFLLRTSKRGSR